MSRILLENILHLVTMNPDRDRLNGVDILIEDNLIKSIAKNIKTNYAKRIDCSTKLVIPGLINSHHHIYQTQVSFGDRFLHRLWA